jgi:hypothetical protein
MADAENRGGASWGVVTFLDILGWKGIYSRHGNPLPTLRELLNGIGKAQQKTRGLITGKTEVKSISDTIAILSTCTPEEVSQAIEAHGILCSWAIPTSITLQIPLRGATSAGKFENQENAFIGEAIDEAASWYEHSDWIGVHLTPSAQFLFKPRSDTHWIAYAAPLKANYKSVPYCVNWIDKASIPISEELLRSSFRQMGPLVPEISGKFVNTLNFFEAVRGYKTSKANYLRQFVGKPVMLELRSTGQYRILYGSSTLSRVTDFSLNINTNEGTGYTFGWDEIELHDANTGVPHIVAPCPWTEGEQIQFIVRRWVDQHPVTDNVLPDDALRYLVDQLMANPEPARRTIDAEIARKPSQAASFLKAIVEAQCSKH